ncbi:MAG: DHA2 family efflux MFS transporter permease subunit [Deltaproteobacteria bacterium]|nr:DHA2 family efflux MFS transporter permease subunit [Deltaproteobacteria bacterium]
MIPTMIEILDTSVANVSLTHIQGSLSAGQEEVTWVLTSYLVANAVVIPMSGWLAGLMGRKRYLIASLIMFTLSSLLCGTATSLAELIFFRLVQGMGGGGLQPMSQAILMETFPPEERGLAMGVFGIGVVVGPIMGPLLGGYLTDEYSWRWIFYINLPVGILAVLMIMAFVFDPPYQTLRAKGTKVDYLGLALLTVGLGCLQIVLDKGQLEDWFSSTYIAVLSGVSLVSLVALVFWELKVEHPILNLRIFKDRSFATGNVVMFMGFFAFFGSIVLLPLYLQNLMGYTSFLAGVVLGPGGLLTLIMLPLAGKLTQRFDARYLLGFGCLVNAVSVWYMSGFNLQIDLATAITGRVIQGIGMPFFFVTIAFVTMAYVPNPKMNNASAIFNLLRNLGASCGVAFVTTMLARRAQFHQNRLVENLTPYDPAFRLWLEHAKETLTTQMGSLADQTHRALALIYGELQRQATNMAFADVFHAQMIIFLGLCGILWIMRKPPIGKSPQPGGH